MSTAPSRQNPERTSWRRMAPALLVAALLCAAGAAHALTADRSQKVNVTADHTQMSQDNEQVILAGHVTIAQGSLHADASRGIGYFDKNNTLQRVVLTGAPAHFQQQLDNGSLVHGSANTIDYQVSENTVILSGAATVTEEGRGSFHGAKLTYNTDSGQMLGEGGTGGQVHMTFLPKSVGTKPAPAHRTKPAPASAPAAPATAAPATPAAPAATAPASGTP